ncbi:hypothetical protein JOD45_000657 [Scopulibacillus daqui]|uniref:Uncharacterized protein n=1 Tax=Scopulibacillus daqui TaxID=1469162 RepID=A0ABS2PYA0_9BACL|nr:DUF3956 family protein [Scopulibacillus daqui]MBM7644464.1 hypothetical protein [Scopulibacillus daqui]
MQQCVLQVNGQWYLQTTLDGITIRLQITSQIAAILQAVGIPLCSASA